MKPETNDEAAVVRRSRVKGRETVRKILYFAQQELESSGLVKFNLDRVIEGSGASHSSVYHHFGGHEGVIAAVETMEMLKKFQELGTARFAALIRELRDRGFCDPIEPIDGTAHLIQSMLLGRILVDIIGDPVAESQWTQSAVATLRFLLRPKG